MSDESLSQVLVSLAAELRRTGYDDATILTVILRYLEG